MKSTTMRQQTIRIAAFIVLLAWDCVVADECEPKPLLDQPVAWRCQKHDDVVAARGGNAEILALPATKDILAVTDAVHHCIDYYALHFNATKPLHSIHKDEQPVHTPLSTEPTSVAAHPSLPVFLACTLGDKSEPGRLWVLDGRTDSLGAVLHRQDIGIGPDSIAIAPDGHWALIAMEAEEDADTPGGLTLIDLTDMTDMLTAEKKTSTSLPTQSLAGLDELLKHPLGDIEPEFVAFDPKGRFAVVTCQENDAFVVVDFAGDAPKLVCAHQLTRGAEPDGVAVLDGFKDDNGKERCLIAIAEEGRKDPETKKRLGQAVSLHWIDPVNLAAGSVLIGRYDVRALGKLAELETRCDPEGVALVRLHGEVVLAVGLERVDLALLLNVTDPATPQLLDTLKTGPRPEGVLAYVYGDSVRILTANEAKDPPGSLSTFTLSPLSED